MRFLLAAALMFGMVLNANASTLKFGQRGETLPVFKIVTFYSNEGETLDEFALRMGVWFRNFTTTSSYEACAPIFASTEEPGRWAMPIYTNHSQIGCAMPKNQLIGYSFTGQTIHSHPVGRQVTPNVHDRSFMQGQSTRFLNNKLRQRRPVDARTFSRTDFASGPGYLVAHGKVLHQNGPKAVREVGVLPPREEELVAAVD